jgi:hypothetical protein
MLRRFLFSGKRDSPSDIFQMRREYMAIRAHETTWYSYTSSTQTIRTWAKVIPAHDDLPQEFRDAFPDCGGTFPYTVLIPGDRLSLFHKRNAKVVCLHDGRITLLESRRDHVKTLSCLLSDITYVVRGKVLLRSWLTFYGVSEPLAMAFDTTNDACFEPLVNAVRQTLQKGQEGEPPHPDHQREMAKLDYLGSLNFKYMNYGRQSVWNGDTVLSTLYQPERCIRSWTLWKKPIVQHYATSHLSILTEHEFILIQESKPTRINHSSLYGGILTYIPKHRIHSIAFMPTQGGTLSQMRIVLTDHTQLHVEFSLENAQLDAFQQTTRKIWKTPESLYNGGSRR